MKALFMQKCKQCHDKYFKTEDGDVEEPGWNLECSTLIALRTFHCQNCYSGIKICTISVRTRAFEDYQEVPRDKEKINFGLLRSQER
jgi:hypothetical protein